MATAQTRASAKYQEKVGLVSRSFKLKKDLCEQFKKACERAGTSQAKEISKFMKQFIEEHPE